MISHVFIGVDHFETALAFYTPLLAELGLQNKFIVPPGHGRAG